MTIHVFNQLTRQVEPLETLEPQIVKMYVCGPTVYDRAHIGHAMLAIVFDVVRRYLAYQGYQVVHVMNFTDVDDKIINRASSLGMTPEALAQRYIDEWMAHTQHLNLLPAHHYPRASQVMPQITQFIQGLIDREQAYTRDGDVFFDVDQFPNYGQLSGRKLASARPGTRVAVDARKEDAADFALWKSARPGEPRWDSPWGPGRPGWHIECSAMVLHYLGSQIDIHAGGNDLIFPHHENEIAQSEAYTGKAPFARYWLHNGMLQMRGEKMSKSIGNLVTVDDFLAENDADVLRLIILGSHYRKPLLYDDDVVTSARRAQRRLIGALAPAVGEKSQGQPIEKLAQAGAVAQAGFTASMDDDFNTAGALGHLFNLVRSINTARDAGVDAEALAAAQDRFRQLAGILGLTLAASEPITGADTADSTDALVSLLVELRAELRQARQWALADRVRDRLAELGFELRDDAQGTSWRKR